MSRREQALVFEDKLEDFKKLQPILTKSGFIVKRAASPDEFEKLKPYSEFSLIVVDFFFKASDSPLEESVGIRLTERVRESEKRVPILVMSSLEPGRDDVVKAFRAGASDYVSKEAFWRDPDALLSRLRDAYKGSEESRLEEELPLPIAFLFRDFRRSHTAFRTRFERLLELFEVTVKFCGAALVASAGDAFGIAVKESTRAGLEQPSLGHWLALMVDLPEPAGMMKPLWKASRDARFREVCEVFVRERNTHAHGAMRAQAVYEKLLSSLGPLTGELLKAISSLCGFKLVRVKQTKYLGADTKYVLEVFRGSNPTATREPVRSRLLLHGEHVYLANGDFTEAVDLFPWLQHLTCETCHHDKLFLYRMARRGEVWLLDHTQGHHLQTTEGFSELQAILSGSKAVGS